MLQSQKDYGLIAFGALLRKESPNCFDYEAFFAYAMRQALNGRELFMYDYSMGANGHVFRNI